MRPAAPEIRTGPALERSAADCAIMIANAAAALAERWGGDPQASWKA
jgi:hypothetical protein